MFTRYDKAGAAVIAAAVGSVVSHFMGLDAEMAAALVTVLTGVLTWAVPNKA